MLHARKEDSACSIVLNVKFALNKLSRWAGHDVIVQMVTRGIGLVTRAKSVPTTFIARLGI